MQKKLCLVAGARPNFSKIAPLIRAIKAYPAHLAYSLVHTGQHYDTQMSEVFFSDLGIPQPDVSLNCGGGSHAVQTARIMTAFESTLEQDRPDWVVVVGDVNSTLACSIVTKKLQINVAHIEAGLRSGDRAMPEEINRMVTDSISDLFFTTEPEGTANLLAEGHAAESVHFVGNLMIDNLYFQLARIDDIPSNVLDPDQLKPKLLERSGRFGAVTLHRPSNVDNPDKLHELIEAINALADHVPLIFPAHPRTRTALAKLNITLHEDIIVTEPMSYMRFLNLWRDAAVVVTDSGGLQEETTALGIACVTARDSTERPITLTRGSNVLAGANGKSVLDHAINALGRGRYERRPDLWDGQAATRIAEIFADQ
ncbi:MAG: non-hydrolyzing UDP-N-acetylglucosamine 2-epimerase [Burkholderiaceae bacterium]